MENKERRFILTGETQVEAFRSRFKRWLANIKEAVFCFPEADVTGVTKEVFPDDPEYNASPLKMRYTFVRGWFQNDTVGGPQDA